jgi:hypothetical protein
MRCGSAKLVIRTGYVATVLAILAGCGGAGNDAGHPAARQRIVQGVRFIGSVDTMKLSKDKAGTLGVGEIDRVVDLLARSMSTTHVTVDAPLERPSVIGAWANRIHADGKHVWFRLTSTTCDQPHGDLGDGPPSYRRGYLTELHELIRTHPRYFQFGDILDGDPEAENSCWWTHAYGCGVQAACKPCSPSAGERPCAPIQQFNAFLANMTKQENIDLVAMRIVGVTTTVHSTDPGTAMDIVTPSLVRSMHGLITIDAYPDQSTTDPLLAANEWRHALVSWHQTWLRRGLNVSILIGEWGYSLGMNVSDATQRSVIQAEVSRAFRSAPYIVGTNYWVGPGMARDGGYTQILSPNTAGDWRFRPAAGIVSSFYTSMNHPG